MPDTPFPAEKSGARPPLRVLILEDSPRDAKLMVALLESAGNTVEYKVIDTLEGFNAALQDAGYDVILADYNLRGWTALDALEILKASDHDVPLIVQTGSLGDEAAAECIKQGASDFVLKDRPARLPAAVLRALEEKRMRKERKRVEAENTKLVSAIEQLAEAVMITDPNGTIEYVNPAFTRITGYTREESLGQTPRLLKSEKQDPASYEDLWSTILNGENWKAELINRRKDGSVYNEQMTITPVHDAHKKITHFIATKQDVTNRKALEEQLRQAAKIEAVGRLAGGVAHDFNNLLTIINGYCEISLDLLDPKNPASLHLQEIKAAGDRAAGLTRQLLTFSRRQVVVPKVLNLNTIVTNVEKMLGRLLGEDVRLRMFLEPSLGSVKADPGQVEQVIITTVL